jgi:hypothetical protein
MGAGQAQERAWLQYRMAAPQTAAAGPSNVILNFATDEGSFADGLFDKPTTARFRTLVACSVRVSYGLVLTGEANNSGAQVQVLKNGSALTFGNSGRSARDTVLEPVSLKRTFRLDMAVNDYLELNLLSLEGGIDITAEAEGSIFLMEFVRRP